MLSLVILAFIASILPVGVTAASPDSGPARPAWVEHFGYINATYVAHARRGFLYHDPIAVRSGQQDILFDAGSQGFIRMDVCVLSQTAACDVGSQGGGWRTLYDGSEVYGQVRWRKNDLPQVGGYQIRMRYYRLGGGIELFNYSLAVVPRAHRSFTDGQGNSMVLWQGRTAALDSPLLVAEGIDANNVNTESHYYALGGLQSTLFSTGRERGADILLLNFADGGRNMRDNAGVVRSAIQYVNQIKTGSRRLDVAGVSMGGVVVRYALAEMEEDGVTHNVARFVSMDAPQQGAVIDRNLLNWMHSPPWPESSADFEVPANVTSVAGQQLLVYNPFDTANPTLHRQFYDELNSLNGDGYPHRTIENVGVSFGASTPNPQIGQYWLMIDSNLSPEHYFFIEAGTDEALPGSLLPEDVTNIGGTSPVFFFKATYGLYRNAHPTFIPYTSALHFVNGVSRFAAPTIAPTTPSFHNTVPTAIVEPLLLRLGYPHPSLTAEISGPRFVTVSVPNTWQSTTYGGDPPYESYFWEYLYICVQPPPPPCGPPGTCRPSGEGGSGEIHRAPPCNVWNTGGTSSSYTRALAGGNSGRALIRLTVEDAAGATSQVTHTVYVQSGSALQAGAPNDSAAVQVEVPPGGLPVAFALDGATPNPFGRQTTLRFALPEPSAVRLAVYDGLGREVARLADGWLDAGWHTARFDGSALPSGVYLVRMEARGAAGAFTESGRITLVK